MVSVEASHLNRFRCAGVDAWYLPWLEPNNGLFKVHSNSTNGNKVVAAMSRRWVDIIEKSISISLRSLDNMETWTVEVDLADSVSVTKILVGSIAGLRPEHQKLMFGRVVMQDDFLLFDYNLFAGCLLHLADTREHFVLVSVGAGRKIHVPVVPSLRVHVFITRIKSAIGLRGRKKGCLFSCSKLQNRRKLEDYKLCKPLRFIVHTANRSLPNKCLRDAAGRIQRP